jgi:hypothetical protein
VPCQRIANIRRILGVGVLIFAALNANPTRSQGAPTTTRTAAQLEQLVAPIALYPDALLSQILMASTYPLEVVAAARWAQANPTVTSEALQTAMAQQPWDPSVKALTAVPQTLQMMNDKLDWTQQLGDAFLAQQSEVLDSVQRLRAREQRHGTEQEQCGNGILAHVLTLHVETSTGHGGRCDVRRRLLSRRSMSALGSTPVLRRCPLNVRITLGSGRRADIDGRQRSAINGREQSQQGNPYSITSSAVASRVAGTVRPSVLAVLRLITSSYFTGACTGRSAGFSPLRMRST